MPLSEHEERVLAEIERQLAQDDPGLMARARRAAPGDPRTRLRWAVIGFVVGLVSLLGLTFHLAFGIVGFALMLVSVVVGAGTIRARGAATARRWRRRLDDAFNGNGDDLRS